MVPPGIIIIIITIIQMIIILIMIIIMIIIIMIMIIIIIVIIILVGRLSVFVGGFLCFSTLCHHFTGISPNVHHMFAGTTNRSTLAKGMTPTRPSHS